MKRSQKIGLWVVFLVYVFSLIGVFGNDWCVSGEYPRLFILMSAFIPLALLVCISFK